ncbi:hypothetical protein G6F42_024639 [Rhizopus arrhizus]|nr:hypothetical protein G6F42_024639 [Rhizopus arrhizus]
MARQKRRVTSSKVPQKVALPAYRYSPSKSISPPDEAPQSSGYDSSKGESSPPGSADRDDPNTSSTDDSHTTSSSGGLGQIPVRPRKRFTTEETASLEQVYRRSKRPTTEIKQRLSRRFNTTMSRIQIWFQNRRAKEKKGDNNQKASTTAEQESNGNNTLPSDDPEEPESSSSTAALFSARRRKAPKRATESLPDGIERSNATRKHKKQKLPVVSTAIPVTHPFLPSGSYAFTYPNLAASMNSPNVSNPPMTNESYVYPAYAPQPPPHARKYFISNADWHLPHIFHPPFPQPFQGPQPTEKSAKYVDPRKVVKPEQSDPGAGQAGDPGSSHKSSSRKGKQKQKTTEIVDSNSEQSSDEEQVKDDL